MFAKIHKNSKFSNYLAMEIDKDHIRLGRDSESILSSRQENARIEYLRRTGIRNNASIALTSDISIGDMMSESNL